MNVFIKSPLNGQDERQHILSLLIFFKVFDFENHKILLDKLKH